MRTVGLVCLFSASLWAAAPLGRACCGVGPAGKLIGFGDQTNIVIWNDATKTEHFIRNASFTTDAKDFGFIAPTPSKPELAEVSDQAFATLSVLTPSLALPMGCAKAADEVSASKVLVVQEKDVAGYHATTLLGSDASSLAAWMKGHGYRSTPGIEAWTKPYIRKGWYLTAFKVINQGDTVSTGTIRMSFKAERPFNPFLVPKDNIATGQKGRLWVYFVSTGDYSASVGSSPWKNSSWSESIPEDSVAKLASQLKLPVSSIPFDAQVAKFEDTDFPRPALDDIYFTKQPGSFGPTAAKAAIVVVVVAYALNRRRKARMSRSPS